MNSGLVAFSTDHWPGLLERWREVCELIPPGEMWGVGRRSGARSGRAECIVMSEIPREAVALVREAEAAFGGNLTVEDAETLNCKVNGSSKTILHYLDSPKPWEPSGWLRLGAPDYVRIMCRLLFATDVPLRLDPRHVPLWLRPGVRGELPLRALAAPNQSIVWSAYKLPKPLRHQLRHLRRRVA